jgi:hypothetical protein
LSLLNCSLNFVGYLDAARNANPLVRMADLTWSLQGIPTGNIRNIPIILAPGETQTITSSARSLSYTAGTSFSVVQVPATSYVRLTAAVGQRASRASGDATTEWAIAVVNGLVTATFTGTGTAPTFSGMLPGDGIYFGSPFNIYNRGIFQLVKVGVNYVQFQNALAQAETLVGQVNVFSSGPVQVGDTVSIVDPAFSFPNRGQFPVTAVTDQWIEYSNAAAIPEVVTGVVSGGIVAYLESYRWMLVAVDGKIFMSTNGDVLGQMEVSTDIPGDIINNPGLLLKRGNVFQVNATNPSHSVVHGFVMLVE